MKKTVVCRIDLGVTRIAGYVLFNPTPENTFEETTPIETAKLVKAGLVNGLKVFDEQLIPDEHFFQQNIKIRSGIGRYRNMVNTEKTGETAYSVIRKIINDYGDSYEVVSSKCGRFECDEVKLRILNGYADIAGIRFINDIAMEISEGVDILDCRTVPKITEWNLDEIVDVGGKLMKVSELDDFTPEELFGTGQEPAADTTIEQNTLEKQARDTKLAHAKNKRSAKMKR